MAGADRRALVARLRAVIEAKDTEIGVLRGELEAAREQFRRLELTVRIRSYLDSTANHGLTALDAITPALAGDPWLPAQAA
ncbi:MAG: hypothetical protein ACRDPY_13845 [Streptosporangiaceae bacterium]